jgi:hypothetical protein
LGKIGKRGLENGWATAGRMERERLNGGIREYWLIDFDDRGEIEGRVKLEWKEASV